MLIPNNTSLESSISSIHPDVFRVHKPVVKAKHRSFAPTVLSLLVGVTEQEQDSENFDHAIADTSSMEGQPRNHGITEKHNTEEDGPLFSNTTHRMHDSRSIYCSMSHRTEDIFIREDEDGKRSHFCPLDQERDGERDENEDYPDSPMQLNYDMQAILKRCNLMTDELPYLVAEKPSFSDSDESGVCRSTASDVDASTSMIYGPTKNLQSASQDSSLQFLLQSRKQVPSLKNLDGKTMAAWTEESSDDDYTLTDKDSNMLRKYVVGDESDMEEFKESVADMKSFRNEKKGNENLKHKRTESGSLNARTGEKSSPNDVENTDSEKVDRSELQTSGKNELDSNGETENDSDGESIPQSSDDQSLKADIEKAILNASRTLGALREEQFRKIAKQDADASGGLTSYPFLIETSRFENTHHVSHILKDDNTCSTKDTHSEGVEEGKTAMPGKDSSVRTADDNKDDFSESRKDGTTLKGQKEGKKAKLTMEPVAMNLSKSLDKEETQPDLATALRFMTEVYHTKDEDELYSDTLSMPDIPAEVGKREKPKTTADTPDYQEIQGQEPTDRANSLQSTRKPNTFEPVLTDEQRTVTRPRNKLTKFFLSFKKKLVKKA